MQIKHIALAAVAALGFNAAQAGVNTSLNNAEIFFVAYDITNGTKSFNFDTGVNVSKLIDGSINYTTSFANDANWTSFVSSVGASNVAWYVQALQFQNGKNTKFSYATLGAGQAVTTPGTNLAFNADVTNLNNALQAWQVGAGQSEVAAGGTPNYMGVYDQFKSLSITQLSNTIGTTNVSFFGAANSDTTKNTLKETIFAVPAAVASLSANGTLTIATPTPVTSNVPEPTTTGLALAGLLVAGAVARRRAAK